jgi:putative DNA-invertase from lambdoid prophage Rac
VEAQLIKSLPEMADGATAPALKQASTDHLGETREHVERWTAAAAGRADPTDCPSRMSARRETKRGSSKLKASCAISNRNVPALVLRWKATKLDSLIRSWRVGRQLRKSLPCRVQVDSTRESFLYTRISTDKQNHDSQLQDLREYCSRHGWTGVEEISDTVSGRNSSRKGLDRLMSAVRHGKVDTVVCFKLDRLGRSLSHLAQIIDEFNTYKVALVVPAQGIDTSEGNPAGKLQLHILCAVAEFEREIIRERVNAGLAVAKKKGVRFGRPATLDAHRDDIARLRAMGKTGRAIAVELRVPAGSVFQVIGELNRVTKAA